MDKNLKFDDLKEKVDNIENRRIFVKNTRKKFGYNQAEFAEKLYTNLSKIKRIENLNIQVGSELSVRSINEVYEECVKFNNYEERLLSRDELKIIEMNIKEELIREDKEKLKKKLKESTFILEDKLYEIMDIESFGYCQSIHGDLEMFKAIDGLENIALDSTVVGAFSKFTLVISENDYNKCLLLIAKINYKYCFIKINEIGEVSMIAYDTLEKAIAKLVDTAMLDASFNISDNLSDIEDVKLELQ